MRREKQRVEPIKAAKLLKRNEFKAPYLKHNPKHRQERVPDNDEPCAERRPQSRNRVWSYHFLTAQTSDGLPVRIFMVIDEYTQECLCSFVDGHVSVQNITDELFRLFLQRGIPKFIRSGTGTDGTAKAIRAWINDLEVNIQLMDPERCSENGRRDPFKERLAKDITNRKCFTTLLEARICIDNWRNEYNRSINLLYK